MDEMLSEELQQECSKFAQLLEQTLGNIRPRRWEVREAMILVIGDNDMVVGLGGKRDGIVLPEDLNQLDAAYRESLKVGDQVPVQIIKPPRQVNGIVVSIKRGLERQDWLRAEKILESGALFEGEVLEVNRGGVLVTFGGLQAFIPNSHLTSVPTGLKRDEYDVAKEKLIGKTLSLVVIEVKQQRRRLIASERAASRQKRQKLLLDLAEGDVRTGVVRNIVDFGVFVDLGGVDGLVHISELAWDYVENPNSVLSVGDEIEVYVLEVDRERQRVALSRKRVIPEMATQE